MTGNGSIVTLAAMPDSPRVLILCPRQRDFDTQHAVDLLSSRLKASVTLIDATPALLPRQVLAIRKKLAGFDVLHAFGPTALAVALAASRSQRIVYSLDLPPSDSQLAWLRAAMAYRAIDVVCSSRRVWRSLVSRGVAAERCVLVRPGVAMPATALGTHAARQQFGLSMTDIVLAAPLMPSHRSGHEMAMWAMSLLCVLDPRHKLLMPAGGPAAEQFADLRKRLIDASSVRLVDYDSGLETLGNMFLAADVVLLTPKVTVPPVLIATAMASGRPIVATTTPQICEFIEDRHTALLVKEMNSKQVAQRVIDLRSESDLSWRLQDRARAEAYDFYTRSKLLAAMRRVYAGEIAEGSPVSNEALPQTTR
ncbi:MAG TPA: glycosyltransferase family 4 protein [Tepidisphaeraceae bacterium]|jgi:glycosyltransferase involved in cell wall biosynthesis